MNYYKKSKSQIRRHDVCEKLSKIKVSQSDSSSENTVNSEPKCYYNRKPFSVDKLKFLLSFAKKDKVSAPSPPEIISPDYNQTFFNNQNRFNSKWKISHEHSKQAVLEFFIRYVSVYKESKTCQNVPGKLLQKTTFSHHDIWATLSYYWFQSEEDSFAENLFFYSYEKLIERLFSDERMLLQTLESVTCHPTGHQSGFSMLLLHELCESLKVPLLHYLTESVIDEEGFADRQDSLSMYTSEICQHDTINAEKSLVVISAQHTDEVRLCIRHSPDLQLCNNMLQKLVKKKIFWTDSGKTCIPNSNPYPLMSYRKRLLAMANKPENWTEPEHFFIDKRKVFKARVRNATLNDMKDLEKLKKQHSYDFYKYGVVCFQLDDTDISDFAPTFPFEYPEGVALIQSDKKPDIQDRADPSQILDFYVQSIQRHHLNGATFDEVHMNEDNVSKIRTKIFGETTGNVTENEQINTALIPIVTEILMDVKDLVSVGESQDQQEDSDENVDNSQQEAPSSSRKRIAKSRSIVSQQPTAKKSKMNNQKFNTLSSKILDAVFKYQTEQDNAVGRLSLSIEDAVSLAKHDFTNLTERDDIASIVRDTDDTDENFHLYHIQCGSEFAKNWPRRHQIAQDNLLCTSLKNVNLEGINTWMEFLAIGDSFFPYHNENEWYGSINYCAGGFGKIWFIVPAHEALEFENWLAAELSMPKERNGKVCFNLSQHKAVWIDVSKIPEKFTITAVFQKEGMFIVTAPGALHYGVNVDQNFCTAINYCSSDWPLMTFASKICSGDDANCNNTVLFPVEITLSLLKEYCSLNTQLDLELYTRSFKIPQKKTKQIKDNADEWIKTMLNCGAGTTNEDLQEYASSQELPQDHCELVLDNPFSSHEVEMLLKSENISTDYPTQCVHQNLQIDDMQSLLDSNVPTDQQLEGETQLSAVQSQETLSQDTLMNMSNASDAETIEIADKTNRKSVTSRKTAKTKTKPQIITCKIANCGMTITSRSCITNHEYTWHTFYQCKSCDFIGNRTMSFNHLKQAHNEVFAEWLQQKPKHETRNKWFFLSKMATQIHNYKSWRDVPPEFQQKLYINTLDNVQAQPEDEIADKNDNM